METKCGLAHVQTLFALSIKQDSLEAFRGQGYVWEIDEKYLRKLPSKNKLKKVIVYWLKKEELI